MANNKTNGYDDEEMTVELELDDGQTVNCAIITILTVKEQDYIVLLPMDEKVIMMMEKYGSTAMQKMKMILMQNLSWAILIMMMSMIW